MAAVIALVFTFLSIRATDSQLQISEQGQITDRYNAAITNLGSSSIDIRLGGVYALQRIMQDSPRDQATIVNVLAYFIQDQAGPAHIGSKVSVSRADGTLPADINAALIVIGSRDQSEDGVGSSRPLVITISNANLSGAELFYLNLNDIDLFDSNLDNSYLSHIHLAYSNFDGSSLERVRFDGAYLNYANFTSCDLVSSVFAFGDLRDSNFQAAVLTNSYFGQTRLAGASFDYSNLTGMTFNGVALKDVSFQGDKLSDVKFEGVNKSGAFGLPGR